MGKHCRVSGYATGAYGKMHLFPYGAVMERGNFFGFDERAAHFHESGERMSNCFAHENPDLYREMWRERNNHGVGKGGDSCAAAFKGYVSRFPVEEQLDWWTSGRAAEFVQRHADEPFLLVNNCVMPHAPHAVPADLADLYDPAAVELPPIPETTLPDDDLYPDDYRGLTRDDLRVAVANYMARVTVTDRCHNRVIEALQEEGLYDDTLIIMTSDHGELPGSRGLHAFSKYNLYEQAIRIPLIIKPPKGFRGQRGVTSEAPISLIDLLPTVMDVCEFDGAESLPGYSFAALLDGDSSGESRPFSFTEYYSGGQGLAVRDGDWKVILWAEREPELYNIAEDAYEHVDLADDSVRAPVLAELREKLLDELARVWALDGGRTSRYEREEWDPRTL
jgi:arylsulfatase A-like enzyme